MIAGGLERVLEMTVNYALDREQFGRPLARFQALQHGAATVAGEVAMVIAALEAAVERADELSIGIAKICASSAVSTTAQFAHQVHGAIGFTTEHALHIHTTRLWAWRDEFGSEEEWAVRVGQQVAAEGQHLWEFLA
jgi:acyl-CoA dehydrogenase